MITDIGSILSSDGNILLKMWEVSLPTQKRPLQNHYHVRFEISIINQGSGTYTVGEHTYPMLPGDMFIFCSNEKHSITSSGTDGLVLTNLQFEPRYLWGNSTDSLSDANNNFCFHHKESFQNRIEAEKAAPLYSLFMNIKEELLLSNSEYMLSVKSFLNLFVIKLLRDYDYAGQYSEMNHAMHLVLEYIDAHFSEDLTLDSLSGLAGLSPNHFSTQFHKVSGMKLWNYINSRRIDKAIHMIMDKECPTMLEVANLCGFHNTANFNKAFKKVTGMTPREYKRTEYY